ncbi:hypothetical protein [Limnoglobus roseus]|uniref:Uncharacterized protein n=1 Tax=Limnoglobus roseus TaxID=2598579 RepID=A0A5C1AD20_9BACT|nr:hypothetical protein [Limnoglobus roseus]QEL15896.1 hypothetical protein PX52LOC_02832 [Limnoglobus roseus]
MTRPDKPRQRGNLKLVPVSYPSWERDWRPSDVCKAGDVYARKRTRGLRLVFIFPGENWLTTAVGRPTGD